MGDRLMPAAMERLTNIGGVPPRLRGGVIALGNFDGFHLGHQAVVRRARAIAESSKVPLIVATFSPHPKRFFRPDAPPLDITTLDQREQLFASAGADAMLVFNFDVALAGMSCAQFAERQLVAVIGASVVVTGADFNFGAGRSGDVRSLHQLGNQLGFTSEAVAPQVRTGDRISSTRIRDSLRQGDCEAATALMTRPFAVEGVLQADSQHNPPFGAIVALGPQYLRPAAGLYRVRLRLADGSYVQAIGNLPQCSKSRATGGLLHLATSGRGNFLDEQPIEVAFLSRLEPHAAVSCSSVGVTETSGELRSPRIGSGG